MEAGERAADPKGLNDFMEMGFLLRKTGGVFHYDLDTYGRLHWAVLQGRRNKEYLEKYSAYVAMDGTHLVDKYGHVLVLLTVVDCLGLTQPVGIIVCPSEDSEIMIKGLEFMGVPKGGVLHTDGGPWGPLLAKHFEREHILCTYHFLSKVTELTELWGGNMTELTELMELTVMPNLIIVMWN